MSYLTLENAVQSADPIFRFLFSQASGDYGFTTEENIVSDSNYTYTPAPVRISSVSQTNEMNKDPLRITFPRTNTFAAQFLGGVPEEITTVTVFRGHRSDAVGEFQFYWKGRVAGSEVSRDSVLLNCENIFTAMRRSGLRARYQRQCRHALYQRGCGVDESGYALVCTVTAASGVSLLVPDLTDSNGVTDGYYTGGMLKTSEGYYRQILDHSGTGLTLLRPLDSLIETVNSSAGEASVTIYPGCDHTRSTCDSKFSNIDNFGGFPWIPTKNPFGNNVSGSIV